MLNFFKKEEEASMTEPLLTTTDIDSFGNGNAFFSHNTPDTHYLPYNGEILDPGYTNYAGLLQYEDGEHTLSSSFNAQEPPLFQITYEKFPERVNKVQRRYKIKPSEQRLKANEAQVILGIEVLGVAQVADVQVFVMKMVDPTFHSSEFILGPQKLATNITQNNGTYRVSVDLDSVYETEVIDQNAIAGNTTKMVKVYKLAKNKTDKVNRFNLKVVVVYVDGSQREVYTERSFIIIGREKKSTASESIEEEQNILPVPLSHGKRQRTDTDESLYSLGSSKEDIRMPHINPQSNISAHSGSSGYNTEDSCINESIMNAMTLVTENLKAKRANIGELIVAKPIQMKGGDIAYQFILKTPDAHPQFMEGEVVGLFVNENGERVLDKLSHKNSLDAVLRGVITRSQFLEAQVQPEGVRVETICMLGIVPVRVRGPVIRGHVVYASADHPGLAVSGSTIGYVSTLKNDAAAVGMAWKTVNCDEDEINLVPCLASITMEIFQGMVEKKVVRLENKIDSEIDTIKKARKKARRRRTICVSASIVFLLLLSILLWQVFMPGTAFRYWDCTKGSVDGHTARFEFAPNTIMVSWCNGVEFTWEAFKKKAQDKCSLSLFPINGTGYHFYLNVDRCAYGGLSSTQDNFQNKKIVGGPQVFAVDEKCEYAYYFSRRYGWCTYHSTKNLRCTPPSHHDHKETTKPLLRYCT